ncbi:lycopene cyclase domain-containing protein [Agromyces sp. GXS1127]|uniref:lycopene cyclase domain-containing protein n=1 Tax=Agromyces sp. GXS1127 TaxID=3424181 RepID=UPI003D31AFBF
MTYLLISLPFVVVALAAAWTGRPRTAAARRRRVVATAIAAGVLVVLTAVFDSLIVGTGIVAYDDARRSGWAIGLAPVEDFLYPLAGVLLLPAVWTLVSRRPAATPLDERADRGGAR